MNSKIVSGLVGVGLAIAMVVTAIPVGAATLTSAQVQAIVSLLQSFGADSSTIANVQTSLTTTSTVVTGTGAQTGTTFNINLTIGSTGSDVVALQSWLVTNGYLTMPAGVSMGYFGSLTRAAVARYQVAKGITPAVGYFGPITRASLNASSVTTTTTTTTTTSSTPGCGVGAVYSSTTGALCSAPVVVGSGTDGSITLSYVSFAPASQTIKKGDMNKPLISVKLQAVNGPVTVTRFDVYFSERPWLDFGSLTLIDSTGKVLATKALNSINDVTEVAVGTNYLVRFDNVNVTVNPGTDLILAVAGNVLAASDKITGQTVYVGIPAGSIRTINGKGYTDSIGLSSGQGSAATAALGNAVTLSASGSTATVYTRISPSTPAQRIVVTSTTTATNNVVLGVFGLKAQNQNATLNSLSFNIATGTVGAATSQAIGTSTLVSNLRLSAGGQTYGANALTAGNTTFTNMAVPLSADVWTDVTLTADIAAGYVSNNISASSTIVAASIGGVDSNYNTVTVTSATNQTSNNITFLQAGVTMTNPVATLGNVITGPVSGTVSGTTGNLVTFSFTLTNTGNTDVYVARTPGALVGTTSIMAGAAAASTASTSLTSLTVQDTQAGDNVSSLAYVIPASGSRSFTLDGTLKAGAGGGLSSITITSIYFNTTAASVVSTSTANSITFGLNALTKSAGY